MQGFKSVMFIKLERAHRGTLDSCLSRASGRADSMRAAAGGSDIRLRRSTPPGWNFFRPTDHRQKLRGSSHSNVQNRQPTSSLGDKTADLRLKA